MVQEYATIVFDTVMKRSEEIMRKTEHLPKANPEVKNSGLINWLRK